MARPCASCSHSRHDEIDRKLKAGVAFQDVARWLKDVGEKPITAQSIGRHARDHMGVASVIGRRPFKGRLLEGIVENVELGLESGELAVSVKDGISAAKELNRIKERDLDRDIWAKVTIAITGGLRRELPPPDPEVEAIEGEFRELLALPSGQ